MLRAVLVDDEVLAIKMLEQSLEIVGGVEVVKTFNNPNVFLQELETISPDLIFLDIDMGADNGLEVAAQILDKNLKASIVFVTAHTRYAVEAFELNALDYVVKPVRTERLANTIERLRQRDFDAVDKKLSINCFREITLNSGENPLNIRWKTKKCLELLAYLLCQKGTFVSKGRIAESLWPDLNTENALSNLYFTYFSLKKQFVDTGIVSPVQSVRGKMHIIYDEIDSDLKEFDNLLSKCQRITNSNIDLAEKAAALYKGALFEDNYYSWVGAYQIETDTQYRNLVNNLTDYFEEKGNSIKSSYYLKIRNQIDL